MSAGRELEEYQFVYTDENIKQPAQQQWYSLNS